MAKVESVRNAQTESPYSVFGSISKGVAGGAVLGYAAKYMLPLNEAEKDTEYKLVTAAIRDRAKELKGLPIEAIRNLEQRTPAQDVFLKMVDAENTANKNGGVISDVVNAIRGGSKDTKEANNKLNRAYNMKKFIRESGLDENGIKELRNIIAQVNEKAKNSCKNYIDSYDASVKRIKRPAIAFMTAGAVLGFFAGLIHKVVAGQSN